MEHRLDEKKRELHTSVRNLVEFIFRGGDIDNRGGRLASAEAMLEGSRIHRKIQKSMGSVQMVFRWEIFRLKMQWIPGKTARCSWKHLFR